MNPKHQDLAVDGLRFHYRDWGGAGVPILLLHGLASTLHIWDIVAPALAQCGRVIALDQRGHGLTDQPSDGYDFDTVAQDLEHFVAGIGVSEKFLLVGHSWGAYTALYFAQKYPHLVAGLVLVDGGMMDLKTQWPTWAEAEAKMTPPDHAGKSQSEIEARIKNGWLGEAWTAETGQLALSVFGFAEGFSTGLRLQRPNHMQIAHALWEFTPSAHYRGIQCPVLQVVPVPPGMSAGLDGWQQDKRGQILDAEEILDNCRVVWYPETTHDIPWHRPARMAADIVNFVQSIPA